MFSSRFLLMSLGAALGGWASATVGYEAAFVINAISFLASAYSVWLVPEEQTRQTPVIVASGAGRHRGYWRDIREGWSYIVSHAPVATIIAINIIWAVGGGAINLIVDRLGALVFAGQTGMSPDAAIAVFYVANGFGLTLGMMIARRVGNYVEGAGRIVGFIGWSLLVQGIFFALMGLMPNVWLAAFCLFASRVVLGAEFAVQDTLLIRLVPDSLRGRVSISDRAAEVLVWSLSTAGGGWLLYRITPRELTVLAGLLSGISGIVWLGLFAARMVRLPQKFNGSAPSVATREVTTAD
jgi:MFS family permease